ncbi:MAG: hypothetical protein ACLGIT_01065 [Gammaproteobacteria bacterium]
MSHRTPLALPTRKPRNPFASAARRRAAGRHGMAGGAVRRQLRRDLQRELDRLKPPHR